MKYLTNSRFDQNNNKNKERYALMAKKPDSLEAKIRSQRTAGRTNDEGRGTRDEGPSEMRLAVTNVNFTGQACSAKDVILYKNHLLLCHSMLVIVGFK